MEATIPAMSEGRNGAARPAPMQIVVREFPDLGKYKIRLVQKSKRDERRILDIREYVNSPTFQGFTRRGVSLLAEEELPKLRAILDEIASSPA
jgi:hypothetical protein